MEFVFVEEHPTAGRERVVRPGMTVGREGSDYVLADPEVSRRHARFRQVDSAPAVEDLGSTNGTFLNNRRISGITELSEGDRLRFGNTVWRLGAGAEPGTTGDRVPTALRQVIPTEAAPGEAVRFSPARAPRPILGGSAARRFEATLVSYLVVIGTAAAVIAYFVQR
jgi:pSer/pThr/pTyr-binding forkhead associated (FHA) protein